MSVGVILGIGLLGGLGALARFWLDGEISARAGRSFPWGTLAVNVIGAFVLGVLSGAALNDDAFRLTGTGLVGAFTTFSTWALESHRLGEEGQLRLGVANFIASLVLGISAAWLGRHIGGLL